MKVLLLTLALSLTAFPQFHKCDLALEASPTVQQLKLGMTDAEVLKIYPNINARGFVSAPLGRLNADARTLRVEFYKNKLSSFSVVYNPGPKWNDALEFGRAASESLDLPLTAWSRLGTTSSAILRCKDFSVSASISSPSRPDTGAMLVFSDLLAREAQKADIETTTEQKKKAFKP